MHRGVIDVLDGTYFVFFEEVLSGGMTCGAIRTFDAIEVAGAVRTSGAVGISDVVGTSGMVRTSGVVTTSGAVGASDAIRISGTVGTSDAIRTSCGAVEGPVDQLSQEEAQMLVQVVQLILGSALQVKRVTHLWKLKQCMAVQRRS